MPIPFIWKNYEIIGSFEKKDGSRMQIKNNYLQAARKYAEFYEEKFGKKAEITIVENAC